jgi:hypothetical protein
MREREEYPTVQLRSLNGGLSGAKLMYHYPLRAEVSEELWRSSYLGLVAR